MNPNEMKRYTYTCNFPNDYDGIDENKDGEFVYHEDAMKVIRSLQEKISGMIEMPSLEVVQLNAGHDHAFAFNMNGQPIIELDTHDHEFSAEDTCSLIKSRVRKALGMKGGSDGGA